MLINLLVCLCIFLVTSLTGVLDDSEELKLSISPALIIMLQSWRKLPLKTKMLWDQTSSVLYMTIWRHVHSQASLVKWMLQAIKVITLYINIFISIIFINVIVATAATIIIIIFIIIIIIIITRYYYYYYYTLKSLILVWLAKSVQCFFEISARDVTTADYSIIMLTTLKFTGYPVKCDREACFYG